MKKILFLGALLFGFATASAQAPLEEGRMQLNGGFGFSNAGVPIYVGLDYGVYPDITVGGEISYRSVNDDGYKYSAIGLVANGNYHFNTVLNIPSEFDFYAGVSVGYYSWSDNTPSGYGRVAHSSGLVPYLQVGGRYFFSENFGLNLEIGGGNISGGKIGVTYKF